MPFLLAKEQCQNTTVSKHWRELKALTPTKENHPLQNKGDLLPLCRLSNAYILTAANNQNDHIYQMKAVKWTVRHLKMQVCQQCIFGDNSSTAIQ